MPMRLHFLPVIIYAGVACGLQLQRDAMKSIKQMWYLQTFLSVHWVKNSTNALVFYCINLIVFGDGLTPATRPSFKSIVSLKANEPSLYCAVPTLFWRMLMYIWRGKNPICTTGGGRTVV